MLMTRAKGVGAGWRWGDREKMGTSVIVSTTKIKKKMTEENIFTGKT